MKLDAKTFEQAVSAHYESLYRFALSLSHREADACDLTQETFRRLAEKGHQLRDVSKLKTWLFTTLYRQFVDHHHRESRFETTDEINQNKQQAAPSPSVQDQSDAGTVRTALMNMEEPFRAALVLFYLKEHSYKEIAKILGAPIGTVMSRISRGREILRQRIEDPPFGSLEPNPANAKSSH